ncbi:MAG: alpha/beta hydrolase [Pseudomonadota bacterium]
MNMRPHAEQFTVSKTTIDTSIGELVVHQQGQGPQTVVLWPSIFTDHRIYDGLVARLSDRFRFVLINGPGHGESTGLGRLYRGVEFGRGMIDVMDALDIQRAFVGGTSWGGLTGAEVAIAAPERVQGLILMNTPMAIDRHSPGLKAKMISLGARWMLWAPFFRNGIARSFFSKTAGAQSTPYLSAFHDMLEQADARALALAVQSVLLNGEPLMPRLSAISAPTLIVAGKSDEMYPIEVQVEASLRLPDSRLHAVDSKHISVVNAPDIAADILQAFVSEQCPA